MILASANRLVVAQAGKALVRPGCTGRTGGEGARQTIGAQTMPSFASSCRRTTWRCLQASDTRTHSTPASSQLPAQPSLNPQRPDESQNSQDVEEVPGLFKYRQDPWTAQEITLRRRGAFRPPFQYEQPTKSLGRNTKATDCQAKCFRLGKECDFWLFGVDLHTEAAPFHFIWRLWYLSPFHHSRTINSQTRRSPNRSC